MKKERVIYILSYFRRIDEEIKFNETEIGEQEDIYYSTIAAQIWTACHAERADFTARRKRRR